MNIKKLALATLVLSPTMANASLTAQGMGMGGVGVASANYLSAPFYNPAMAAIKIEGEGFGILLPSVSANLNDKDNLIDGIDEVDTMSVQYEQFEEYQKLVASFSEKLEGKTPAEQQALMDSEQGQFILEQESKYGAEELAKYDEEANDLLDDIADSATVRVSASSGFAVAIPTEVVSASLFASAKVDLYATPTVSERVINTKDRIDSSKLVVEGFGRADLGLSFASTTELFGESFAIGVSPKYQKILSYTETVDIDDTEVDDYKDSEVSESGFNFDLGFAWYKSGFTFGLSGRDLMGGEITSKNGTVYELTPMATAGVSYSNRFITVASDVELTEETRIKDLEMDNTQLASIGVEGNLYDWVQLRAGYIHDLSGNLDGAYTAGVGVSPFDLLHIDVGAKYTDDRDLGASASVSFEF